MKVELQTISLDQIPFPRPRRQWGKWFFVKKTNILEYRERTKDGSHYARYYIDLDRMRTSAECLDWIFQVHGKTWMSDRDRTDLLNAIRERIHPQANLCSFGIERGKE